MIQKLFSTSCNLGIFRQGQVIDKAGHVCDDELASIIYNCNGSDMNLDNIQGIIEFYSKNPSNSEFEKLSGYYESYEYIAYIDTVKCCQNCIEAGDLLVDFDTGNIYLIKKIIPVHFINTITGYELFLEREITDKFSLFIENCKKRL